MSNLLFPDPMVPEMSLPNIYGAYHMEVSLQLAFAQTTIQEKYKQYTEAERERIIGGHFKLKAETARLARGDEASVEAPNLGYQDKWKKLLADAYGHVDEAEYTTFLREVQAHLQRVKDATALCTSGKVENPAPAPLGSEEADACPKPVDTNETKSVAGAASDIIEESLAPSS